LKDLIKQLTEAYGPPGYEQAVRDIIQGHITSLADRVEIDPLGNLHAVRQGSGTGLTIMLAAHMDEIGLMVSYIDEQGFARLTALGGVRAETMVGNRAVFTNGALGVINVEKWPRNESLDHSHRKLYLDFGVKSKKEVPVRIGDVAGFQRPFVDLGETLVAKSMDDRIGCAILIELLKQLEETPHEVHVVFTVQGPAIKVMDRGFLAHPGLKKWMVETAIENKIPYQLEILTMGTTDARAMQLAHEGNAAGALSIPCRHVHTPSEMVSYSDVQNAVKLLLAMLSGPAKLNDG